MHLEIDLLSPWGPLFHSKHTLDVPPIPWVSHLNQEVR